MKDPDGNEFEHHGLEALKKLGPMCETDPLFKFLYPRRYVSVPGWPSPKSVAHENVLHLQGIQHGHRRGWKQDESLVHACCVIIENASNHMPTYWMGRDLLSALLRTTPPPDLMWGKLTMPIPSALILIPEGMWIDADGRYIRWLAFADMRKGWAYEGPHMIVEPSPRRILSMCAGSDSLSIWSGWIPEEEPFSVMEDSDPEKFQAGWGIEKIVAGDCDFAIQMNTMCLNIIMYLLTRKERELPLSDAEGKVEAKARKPASPQDHPGDLWSPTWLGKEYRLKRGEPKGGHHSSPHVHWRVGHMRNQPYGPKKDVGERPTRPVWIEPVLVNA